MKIILASPRGFCAGVDRAIEIVMLLLKKYGKPIYVRHELVHNQMVVQELKAAGVIFVQDIDQIPKQAVAVFSAHGVSAQIKQQAAQRDLNLFDATCPLVTKVHRQVQKAGANNTECILIGHKGHVEVEGTLGNYFSSDGKIYLVENVQQAQIVTVSNPDNLIWNTQTTLSIDDTAEIIQVLKNRFPNIKGPNRNDICYATQNRQEAVKSMLPDIDLLIVAGSVTSSNSTRLYELGLRHNIPSYLIEKPDDVPSIMTQHKPKCIGLTAGASTPENMFQLILQMISNCSSDAEIINYNAMRENTRFELPVAIKALNIV